MLCKKCGHPMLFSEGKHVCLYCLPDEPQISKTLLPDERYDKVTNDCHSYLLENKDHSLEYLKGRGVSAHTVEQWQLGYVPAGYQGINEICGYKKSEMWSGRILFPILDENRETIGYGGRALVKDADIPKYVNTRESERYEKRRSLYGIHNVPKRTNKIYLCEGYMDAISLSAVSFQYPVASLGTALTNEQAALIYNRTAQVVIAYDSDEPGQMAVKRAIPILLRSGFDYSQIFVMVIDGAKDVDEVCTGKGNFREVPLTEYLRLKKDTDALVSMYTKSLHQRKEKT